MLYLRKEYLSLLGGTYHGSCILQGYVDEKRLKTPALHGMVLACPGSYIHRRWPGIKRPIKQGRRGFEGTEGR